jgi:hypothetical protein
MYLCKVIKTKKNMKAIPSNIKEARAIAEKTLKSIGLEFSFVGMSDTNGLSVYFNLNGFKVRFSDHQITNMTRMQNEICFYFDANEFNLAQSILKLMYKIGCANVVYGQIDYVTQSGKVLKAFGYSKI